MPCTGTPFCSSVSALPLETVTSKVDAGAMTPFWSGVVASTPTMKVVEGCSADAGIVRKSACWEDAAGTNNSSSNRKTAGAPVGNRTQPHKFGQQRVSGLPSAMIMMQS